MVGQRPWGIKISYWIIDLVYQALFFSLKRFIKKKSLKMYKVKKTSNPVIYQVFKNDITGSLSEYVLISIGVHCHVNFF